MKTQLKMLTVMFCGLTMAACNNKKEVEPGTYVDLNTGDSIEVIADPATGYAINRVTSTPVYLYVDNNRDTLFTTGAVVNNKIYRTDEGYYELDEAKIDIDKKDDVTIKYADYKKKIDGDDYKIKDGDYKLKVEGDGDMKLKDGDYKKKVDEDGEVKIKDGDSKVKIDEDGTVKRKN